MTHETGIAAIPVFLSPQDIHKHISSEYFGRDFWTHSPLRYNRPELLSPDIWIQNGSTCQSPYPNTSLLTFRVLVTGSNRLLYGVFGFLETYQIVFYGGFFLKTIIARNLKFH